MEFDTIKKNFHQRFNKDKVSFIGNNKEHLIKAVTPQKTGVPYDISLNVGMKILAIIKFQSFQYGTNQYNSGIRRFANENRIKYIILSDGKQFSIKDIRTNHEWKKVDYKKFIIQIRARETINLEIKKEQIAGTIKNVILESDFRFLREKIHHLLTNLLKDIEYDEISELFSFRSPTDLNNIENQIFRLLLKEDTPLKRIYRYTTLDTIFAMLKYNTFRMNCLVGMNDTTEVNYAENYIRNSNQDYSQAAWQTVEKYNRRFISSSSQNEDDLTQWRLYADDSRGVCLVFDVEEKQLDSRFILKRISYGKKDGTHPELDLLIEIISRLKSDLNIDFDFKTLGTWRHFFKPYDYTIENEVRLLYILDGDDVQKEWLLTNSHNILNPYVAFQLNEKDLPLQLSEIVLGPKCPEKEINKKQFEQFIRELKKKPNKKKRNGEFVEEEYNISKLKISISKINNYR